MQQQWNNPHRLGLTRCVSGSSKKPEHFQDKCIDFHKVIGIGYRKMCSYGRGSCVNTDD